MRVGIHFLFNLNGLYWNLIKALTPYPHHSARKWGFSRDSAGYYVKPDCNCLATIVESCVCRIDVTTLKAGDSK
jgi:hypothetical protein